MTSHDVTPRYVIIIIISISSSSSNSQFWLTSYHAYCTRTSADIAEIWNLAIQACVYSIILAANSPFLFSDVHVSPKHFSSFCILNHYEPVFIFHSTMTHVIFSVLVCYVLSAAAACRRSPNVECSVSSRARNISDMELSCVRPRNTCRALPPSSLHQTWDYRIQVDNLSTRRSRTPLVMHVVPFQYRIRTLPQRTRIISNRRSRCIFSGDEKGPS